MVDRRIHWRYIGMAFVLTAVVFVGILFLGQELSKYKIDNLENDINQLETEQRATSMTRLLANDLGQQDCSAQRILANQNVDELYDVRRKVVQHRQSSKIESAQFEQLKRKYLLATLENYLRQRNLEQTCNDTKVKVLYFHSNDCDTCEGQGKMLTRFREEYDEELLVYPLDADYDLEPIQFLLSYHEIGEYPAIVVDDKVYQGFTSRQDLREAIETRINGSEGPEING